MIGYKMLDKNLYGRNNFKYEVGKTYSTNFCKNELEIASGTVLHFCRRIEDLEIASNREFSDSRVCEVIAEGDIVHDEGYILFGTNKLRILRELSKEEIKNFTEIYKIENTGDYNKGYYNAGDFNDGNHNTGHYNKGNYNTGYYNKGNYNTGDHNLRGCNVGSYNTGECNVGGHNTGHFNTGSYNTGSNNTSSNNFGHDNTGDCNIGNSNTGKNNFGNFNTGDYNIGNHNIGNWNTGDCNYGYFNTDMPKKIRIFNKETSKTDITLPSFLYFNVIKWVPSEKATAEEATKHKEEIELSGGFKKIIPYKDAFRIAWNNASIEEHRQLLKLPNWNNDIFKEISGIDAEKEIAEEEIRNKK